MDQSNYSIWFIPVYYFSLLAVQLYGVWVVNSSPVELGVPDEPPKVGTVRARVSTAEASVRARMVHKDWIQVFPLFASAVLLANIATLDPEWTWTALLGSIIFRLFYTWDWIVEPKTRPLRAFVYLVSNIPLVTLIVQAAVELQHEHIVHWPIRV